MDYSQVFPVGRSLRILLGVSGAGVLWLGNPQLTGNPFQVLGFLGVVVILYVIIAMRFGRRVIARVNPWVGAILLDSPVELAFVPFVPDPLKLALLLFFAISMVCAGACSYGGCEVLAIPNMLLGARYNVACILFSPIDFVEGKLRKLVGAKADSPG